MIRLRGRPIAGVAVVSVVLAGAALWAVVLQSPLFDLRHLEVRGTGRLASGDVTSLLAGMKGQNLLLVSSAEVEGRVRRNPWVADVDVERRLPSTLVLRIREHVAVAWVRDPAGGVLLAADGTALERRRNRKGMVSLGRVRDEVLPGMRAPVPGPLLRVVGALSPRVRREVASAGTGREGVVLRMRSGARILFGPAEQVRAKGATLQALLRWMGEHGVPAGLIDLRAPATPAIRPAESPVTDEAPADADGHADAVPSPGG